MSTFNGTLMTDIISPPSDGAKADAAQIGTKLRAFIETIDLENTNVDAGDKVRVARIPANSRLLGFLVCSTHSLSTSTLAFGTEGTAAAYATAKAYGTTANEWVFFGDADKIGDEITSQTDVYMTVAGADLPNAGNRELKVIAIYADLN